eukprot:365486-Chlamydomonas_euryale.AAC.14
MAKIWVHMQTGGASILAEAMHSVADILNQLLLRIGVLKSLQVSFLGERGSEVVPGRPPVFGWAPNIECLVGHQIWRLLRGFAVRLRVADSTDVSFYLCAGPEELFGMPDGRGWRGHCGLGGMGWRAQCELAVDRPGGRRGDALNTQQHLNLRPFEL